MLSLLDGGAASAHTVASLRAACEALRAGGGRVSAVSVSGSLAARDGAALPVLAAAERLATEYDCSVMMRLDGRTFQIRFSGRSAKPEPDAREAG